MEERNQGMLDLIREHNRRIQAFRKPDNNRNYYQVNEVVNLRDKINNFKFFSGYEVDSDE